VGLFYTKKSLESDPPLLPCGVTYLDLLSKEDKGKGREGLLAEYLLKEEYHPLVPHLPG